VVFTSRADSVNPAGRGLILSLEGLNRLARHVIRAFVMNASTVQEEPFEYRSALPGVMQIELSPEYWVSVPEGLSAETAGRHLQGFVEVLLSTLGPSGETLAAGEPTETPRPIKVDMRPLLSRIEELVPRTGGPSARRSMIAIYFLWHRILNEEFHLPSSSDFLARYRPQLEKPSMQASVVAMLVKAEPDWSTSDFEQLAQQRLKDRAKGDSEPFPAIFDAALAVAVAMQLASDGRRDEAVETLSRAVEEAPGNARLMTAEAGFLDGAPLQVDLTALVLLRVIDHEDGRDIPGEDRRARNGYVG
jgi:hypothetical protein